MHCCAPFNIILPSMLRSSKWYPSFLFQLRHYIKLSFLTSALLASPIESSLSSRWQLVSKMRSTNYDTQNVWCSFVTCTFLPSHCTHSPQTVVTKHLQFMSGPQNGTVLHNYLTLRLLISYIYGAPSKARNANVVYIWTYIWQR